MSKRRKIRRKVNKKVLLVTIIFVLLIAIVGVAYNFLLVPKIDLKGGNKIKITYKTEYKEKGYKSTYLGKDLTDKVKTEGKVNTTKIGEYKVTYEVGEGLFKRKVTRYVEVVDDIKPELSISNEDLYVCPGDEVVPEKVSAKDNYDDEI